jgi:hypothetical protein
LPFSFDHSGQTQEAVLTFIKSGRPDPIKKIRFKINKHPQRITVKPEFLNQLTVYARLLSDNVDSLPYRQQIQLDTLAEASAALRGDSQVRQVDIARVGYLSTWLNYKFNAI